MLVNRKNNIKLLGVVFEYFLSQVLFDVIFIDGKSFVGFGLVFFKFRINLDVIGYK